MFKLARKCLPLAKKQRSLVANLSVSFSLLFKNQITIACFLFHTDNQATYYRISS